MMKIKNYRKAKASLIAITMATAISLTGCTYTGDLFRDISSIVSDVKNEDVENVSIPKSIEPISFYEEEIDDKTVLKTSIDSLEGINAYLTYTSDGKHLYYSLDFLIPVVTDDYVAYYDAFDGSLVKVVILNYSNVNRNKYNSYIEKGIVEIGKVSDELYNPNYSDFIYEGIDFDNNTITRKSLIYIELGYLNKNQEAVEEIIDDLYQEKGLK